MQRLRFIAVDQKNFSPASDVGRKFIHEKLDHYVVALRTNGFPGEVYEDMIIRLAQQEADMLKMLAAQSQDPASLTQQRIKELQKLLKP